MTYTHLTTDELVMIEAYFHQETPVAIIAARLKRSRQSIYNVINFLKLGHTRSIITPDINRTRSAADDERLPCRRNNSFTFKTNWRNAGRWMSS